MSGDFGQAVDSEPFVIDKEKLRLITFLGEQGFNAIRVFSSDALVSSDYISQLSQRLSRGEIEGYVVLPMMEAKDRVGVEVYVKYARR